MAPYILEGVKIEDAAELSRNNMTAYSTDPTWILLWDVPLTAIIDSCTKRMPWNLLKDRERPRHTKALDPETGKILGYARWILPQSKIGSWPEVQVPEVSKDEARKHLEIYTTAPWNTRSDMDVLDDPVHVIQNKILKEKQYLGKHTSLLFGTKPTD
jgi:hypothetical protein